MLEKINEKKFKIATTTKFMFHVVKTLKELIIMIFLFASTLKDAAT